MCMSKLCVDKLCVDKLCVRQVVCGQVVSCVRVMSKQAAGAGESGSVEAGVHNQKQEPHTKMWGKR